MLTHCPKCGHTPLPANQSFPAACPSCGVILAKVGQIVRPSARALPNHASTQIEIVDSLFTDLLTPKPLGSTSWWAYALLLTGLATWGVQLMGTDYRSGELAQSFIHLPLLVFHEAGHVIFRAFGEWMAVFGGTACQLLMPLIITIAFLRQNKDPLGASVGLWLLGASILDVAPYQYDALEPKLMLLSGTTGEEGGHDWIYLFSSLGVLSKAHFLAGLTHLAGVLVILVSLVWATWLLWSTRRITAS